LHIGTFKFARQGVEKSQPTTSQAHRVLLYYSTIAIAIISIVMLPTWLLKEVRDYAWLGAGRLSVVSTDRFFRQFKTAKPALGSLVADEAVIALAPRLFSLSERIAQFPESKVVKITEAALRPASADGHGAGKVDSFLFFKNSLSRDRLTAAFGAGYRIFGIAGTNIFLATTRGLPIDGLTTLLEPVNRLYPFMATSDLAQKSLVGIHIHARSQLGVAIYGPYVMLPAGQYRVKFFFANVAGAEIQAGCRVDVFASGKTFADNSCVNADNKKARSSFEVPLDFTVTQEDRDRLFEFRVWVGGDREMEMTDMTLEFCGARSCNGNENTGRL
jgi:hypothetical protein